MATTKGQLLEALIEGDSPEGLVCFYQPCESGIENYGDPVRCSFGDLPEREFDDGYGSTEGEPAMAFSPRYVYIKIQHDGAEWFTAIPRHPKYIGKSIPWPGD